MEEEEKDDDSCQSDDTEEDSNDETAAIVEINDKHTCDDEGGADLDTIPEGEDVEGNSKAQDEEYSGKKYMKVFDKTEKSWCYNVIKRQPAIFFFTRFKLKGQDLVWAWSGGLEQV